MIEIGRSGPFGATANESRAVGGIARGWSTVIPKGPGAVVVLGATGAVGREVLGLLADRGVEASRVRALASERSAGVTLAYGAGKVKVREVSEDAFVGASVAIFAGSADVSRRWAPVATARGVTVIDNSSAFRLEEDVPLVVPEINADEAAASAADGRGRVLANPNCSTILLLVALEPLRRAFGVRRIDVATYQAVSGAGLEAIAELEGQVREFVAKDAGQAQADSPHQERRVFREPCAFNVFSHDSAMNVKDGVNGEERKIIEESRKIWRSPALRITPTCVRVPVVRAHTMAVTVELGRNASEEEVRSALAAGDGVSILDDREANSFPTPLKASGQDRVLVGRIRPDPAEEVDSAGKYERFCLLLSGDQLRKGAATNAVQIAEVLDLLTPVEARG